MELVESFSGLLQVLAEAVLARDCLEIATLTMGKRKVTASFRPAAFVTAKTFYPLF